MSSQYNPVVLLNDEELSRAPETFTTKKAIGKGFENLHFRVQVFPLTVPDVVIVPMFVLQRKRH